MSFLSGIFKKKPGGTLVGNFLRSSVKTVVPFMTKGVDKVSGYVPPVDAEGNQLLTDIKAQNDAFQAQLDANSSGGTSTTGGNPISNTIAWAKARIEELTGGLKSTGDNLGKASSVADDSTNKLILFGGLALVAFLILKPSKK